MASLKLDEGENDDTDEADADDVLIIAEKVKVKLGLFMLYCV